jgi:RNA polymerase sigma-70 factor (ECF subfamily)
MSQVEVADAQSPDPAEMFAAAEFQQILYQRAIEVMQTDFPGKTWQACKRVVVDGQSAAEVAAGLDMTIGAVHAARLRVLTRLREELSGLVD